MIARSAILVDGRDTRRAQEFSWFYPYVLKCDIEHFFPCMDHEVLFARFSRLIANLQTLRLCNLILERGVNIHTDVPLAYFPGDDLFSAAKLRGLPIGNLTSLFWANVYLDPLDQFIKSELKCTAYIRYVDDFLLFSADKASLHTRRMERLSGWGDLGDLAWICLIPVAGIAIYFIMQMFL